MSEAIALWAVECWIRRSNGSVVEGYVYVFAWDSEQALEEADGMDDVEIAMTATKVVE